MEKIHFFGFFFYIAIDSQEEALSNAVWIGSSRLAVPEIFRFYFKTLFSINQLSDLMKKIENTNFFFPVRYQTNWKQVEIYYLLLSTNAHVVSRHLTITTSRTTKNLFVLQTSTSRGIFIDWSVLEASKKIIWPPPVQVTDFIRT